MHVKNKKSFFLYLKYILYFCNYKKVIEMILQLDEIRDYGVRIDEKVPTKVVEGAIKNAELQVVKPILGNDNYNKLVDLATTEPKNALIEGGEFVNGTIRESIGGIKCAIANIACAFVLIDNVSATVYGTVTKKSAESNPVDPYEPSRTKFTIGRSYVNEVARCMGLDVKQLKNPSFNMWL